MKSSVVNNSTDVSTQNPNDGITERPDENASGYKYLEMRSKSSVRQPFVKGRGIWAEILYRQTLGDEARTSEELANAYDVPLQAVLEAIDFCVNNSEYLEREHNRQEARTKEWEARFPPLAPKPRP